MLYDALKGVNPQNRTIDDPFIKQSLPTGKHPKNGSP